MWTNLLTIDTWRLTMMTTMIITIIITNKINSKLLKFLKRIHSLVGPLSIDFRINNSYVYLDRAVVPRAPHQNIHGVWILKSIGNGLNGEIS